MKSSLPSTIFFVVVIVILFIVGFVSWQGSNKKAVVATPSSTPSSLVTTTTSNLKTFSSEKILLQHPKDYTVTSTLGAPILTVEKANNKRMEIFQIKDFGGDRPFGLEGGETQAEIDGYVPKETLTVGAGENQYDVWLFYSAGDTATKNELHRIFNSIEIK